MTATAKLFMNGRCQAVRLPAEFRISGTEILIERIGKGIVLRRKSADWDEHFWPSLGKNWTIS